jgi:uncharacterized damage-inducible protein DinB
MADIRKLVGYKAWANDLLLDAVAKLPETALVAPEPLIFGNLVRTLNHVYAMDYVWQSHLLGRKHGLTTRNPDDCPPYTELADAQRKIDAWYIEYADALTDTSRDAIVEFDFIGGGPGSLTREEILLHAVNHGTYHRGHVSAMMNRNSVPAPITDLPVFLREWRAG